MTARAQEEQEYKQLLDEMNRHSTLSDRHLREREELEASLRNRLNQVLGRQRDVLDISKSTQTRIEALSGRVHRLAARAGVPANPDPAVVTPPVRLPETLSDFSAAMVAAEADLKSVESSWDWVERAKADERRREEASAATHTLAAPSTIPEPVEAEAVPRKGCLGRALAIFGNALVLILVVVAGR